MGAAYLDEQLGVLLRKALVADKEADRLLDPESASAPLGSFAARIQLAYCLGFIRPKVRHDLTLIRKLRNDFAHTPAPRDFSTPQVADRVRALRTDALGETVPGASKEPRAVFLRAVLAIAANIHDQREQLQQPTVPEELDYSGFPEQWRRFVTDVLNAKRDGR